jgi:hypothetical protein
MSVSKVNDLLKDFYPFAKERLGFDRVPKIKFLSNPENSTNPLGKTAFYESENDTVSVYVDNRHPKDILRSISHELVHHTQNCRGQLSNISTAGEQGYAQNDLHLREMERQAYELGNMCFRDWEDGYKMSRGDNMNIQEMVRSILKNLKEQKVIEVPLKEQDEPFPVGARVTHRAKTTLGVGTVIKMGKKPQERRIEWKESFRKAQTTTENIMMLDDASVKENTSMSKDILEEGFNQRLRSMVEEQIKVALENALLSEEDTEEVSIDVNRDGEGLTLQEKVKDAVQTALLQEEDKDDDDDDDDDKDEKQTPEERAEDIKGKGESVASELEDTPDDEKADVLKALRNDDETNEGKRVYNRDEDEELNEGYSRLAQAGKRELNVRHNRLFEALKNKWIK